jgi:hypothetical protein
MARHDDGDDRVLLLFRIRREHQQTTQRVKDLANAISGLEYLYSGQTARCARCERLKPVAKFSEYFCNDCCAELAHLSPESK